MTQDQQRRKAAFEQLFAALPGKNADKVRTAAKIMCCAVNTIRIYRMRKPGRVPPDSRLQLLRNAIANGAHGLAA